MNTQQKLITILGTTSSGKSDLAVNIARKFNGEVISADSRQVYKGMDIASGKVLKKEMKGIFHHLLDVASPKRTFTVTRYQRLASGAVQRISKKGKLPIITGGTGLYIDSVLYNYHFPHVKPDPELRRRLEKKTTDELFLELQRLDPERALTIEAKNKRRLVRALEIIKTAGKVPPPLSRRNPLYNVLKIGIRVPQDILRTRIEKRLMRRMKQGMVKEVERLRHEGLSWQRLDNFGLEYRYVSRFLRGMISKKEMEESIVRESMKYARRQNVWWKKDADIKWIESPEEAVKLVSSFLRD